MGTEDGYKIVIMTVDDSDRVIDFLYKYFFRDEPLTICVDLLAEPNTTCIELENYCRSSIPDGVSLMALNDDNEILAVAINGINKRTVGDEDAEKKDDALASCQNSKFKKILNLLITVERNSDIFGLFPDVDECVDIRVVSVSGACRGRGVARALFDKVKYIAIERGIPMIRVDCTSHFSYMAAVKLGYEIIYELQYSDHLDEDGQPVFVPEEPHRSVKTCVLRVI